MRAGQVQLLKVDTDEMPADMLTKFLPKAKIDKSIIFITNSTNPTLQTPTNVQPPPIATKPTPPTPQSRHCRPFLY